MIKINDEGAPGATPEHESIESQEGKIEVHYEDSVSFNEATRKLGELNASLSEGEEPWKIPEQSDIPALAKFLQEDPGYNDALHKGWNPSCWINHPHNNEKTSTTTAIVAQGWKTLDNETGFSTAFFIRKKS